MVAAVGLVYWSFKEIPIASATRLIYAISSASLLFRISSRRAAAGEAARAFIMRFCKLFCVFIVFSIVLIKCRRIVIKCNIIMTISTIAIFFIIPRFICFGVIIKADYLLYSFYSLPAFPRPFFHRVRGFGTNWVLCGRSPPIKTNGGFFGIYIDIRTAACDHNFNA